MMKQLTILHIGREENMDRYTERTQFTDSVRKVCLPMGLPVDKYLSEAADADVIIADAIAEVPRALIEAMPNLKLIHSEGVAFNRIDLEAAGRKGVYVCNCAGMNATAVAEQAVLLMLGVLRDVANNDRAVREGRQIQVKEGYMTAGNLYDLSDCRVGLIGLGHIGQCTADLLKAFNAHVCYTQRSRLDPADEAKHGVHWADSLDQLLETCDIVSLHLPVTPETEKMCNAEFFGKMKRGCFFINTSRGELVDDEALIGALKSGQVAMAGLDTLEHEPVRTDHILLKQPEVTSKILFSPHIGGITASSFRRGYRIIWRNILHIAEGTKPDTVVNGQYLEKR